MEKDGSHYLLDHSGRQFINLGEHFLDDGYQADFHTHHMLEISCIKYGTGTYLINGRSYPLQEGDVMIIGNTDPHRIEMGRGERLVNLVIHFEPEFIWNTLNHDMDYQFLKMFYEKNAAFSHQLDRENPATRGIFRLLLEIEREFLDTRPAYGLMIKAKLMTIFASIARYYPYSATEKDNLNLQKNMREMTRVLDYINENLTADLTLDSLADVACMSPTYFSANFKRLNGLSPFEYISSKRIQLAISYLKSTSKNVTEIATLCGFNTTANFNKTFKKITGCSPSNYR